MVMRWLLLGCVAVSVLLQGCMVSQPTHRASPDLLAKLPAIKTVVILPPQVDVLHVEAGGIPEKMDEWTDEARKQLTDALVRSFKYRFGNVEVLSPADALSPDMRDNLEETEALFGVVDREAVEHTYAVMDANGNPASSSDLFKEQVDNFVYSLGREVQEIRKEADAIVLLRGTVIVKSTGLKALDLAEAIVTGVLSKGRRVSVAPSGFVNVRGAFVDAKTGNVLWFNYAVTSGREVTSRMLPAPIAPTDVRSSAASVDMIYQLFKDLPKR